MKPIFLAAATVLIPAAMNAQNPSPSPGAAPQQAVPSAATVSGQSEQQDSTAAPGVTGQQMKDKIFLRKAAEGGLAEVRMGQLAVSKGSGEDVKTFGAKMVADHTMLGNEMKPIADVEGIRLPNDITKMDKAEFERLSGLSGEEFDKEYIAFLFKAHRKDLREFAEEASATQDSTIREAIDKATGIMREHMRTIVRMAREKSVPIQIPGRPEAPPPRPPSL